ncbi:MULTISPECIES: P-II family nitrogen regulator [Streptacidiphilus]|uniref:P-II family nitrogen regulator n=2 Tax=Streptacidiphilus TaxID=228398 RepID=A0ABV6UQB6_9ACTN|nr:P-II family nitrogen regulator [Streptacidiphilus jeojiense]
MKLITAVLPTAGFEQVQQALRTLGIPGITVSTVMAPPLGRVQGTPRFEVYRGVRRQIALRPAVRMDIVTTDLDAVDVVQVITVAAGGTGGAVWVLPVDTIVRIRTKERGEAAL